MTKRWRTTCAALCLALLVGCTSVKPQPTPLPTDPVQRVECPLVLYELPDRPAPAANEDWTKAVDALEAVLKLYVADVADCIKRQSLGQPTREPP